jgi:hypothetical protein
MNRVIRIVCIGETWIASWPDGSWTGGLHSAQQALDEAMDAGYTRFEIREMEERASE